MSHFPPYFCSFLRPLGVVLLLAGPGAYAATITGTVFEDANYGGGAGRPRTTAGTTTVPNARVELYRASNGAFLASTTSSGAGSYSFTYNGSFTVIVRVVTGTLRSQRSGGSACTTCVSIQTFATTGVSGTAVAVTNQVGGADPRRPDAPSNLSSAAFNTLTTATQTPHSSAQFQPTGNNSTISGADFGFNFSTIVATRDAANCAPSGANNSFYPCQGTIRQFIINANGLLGQTALAQSGSRQLDSSTSLLPGGFESSIFMIPNGAANPGQNTGYTNQLNASGVAEITLATALPTLTRANLRLDATTQTVNVGNTNAGTLGTGGSVGVDNLSLPLFQRPEVQLNSAASGAPLTLSGSNQEVHGFALRQGYIRLTGNNSGARNNLVGMTATGSSADVASAFYGIQFSGSNTTIRGNFVTVNNSGIRADGGGADSTISENEVARPSSGHGATFDGILLINGSSGVTIRGNLARDQRGGGIELGFGLPSNLYQNITVSNNTVSNNGWNSPGVQSTEGLGMTAYNMTANNVLFSRNRVQNNGGPGMMVMATRGVTISQNSFSSNRTLAIDLDPNTRDPNGYGTPNGPTLNDTGDSDSGPNDLLNFPVVADALILGGELHLRGFARPGSIIELYLAQADPSGFGEGLTYMTTLTEGSTADLSSVVGGYGPGAIHGVVQGSDNTQSFFFRLPLPSGLVAGMQLTATATLNGSTSEFSGLAPVRDGPLLNHLRTVSVYSDPIHGVITSAVFPKSIPGSLQTYTLRLTNQASGTVDSNSLAIVNPIEANTSFCLADFGGPGSGPVAFIDGSPSSGLSYNFLALNNPGDRLDFSNDSGVTWNHAPIADAFGCDNAITHIRVRPTGTMAGNSSAGDPWFELRFRVRVK